MFSLDFVRFRLLNAEHVVSTTVWSVMMMASWRVAVMGVIVPERIA